MTTGFLALTLLVCVSYGAQIGVLSGPVIGYVFDPDAASFRPLRGALGSATIGPAIRLGYAVSDALTLDARYGIVSTDRHADVSILNLGSSPPALTPIAGVPAHPSVSVANSGGTAAAFYRAAEQRVWIVNGLPREPRITHVIDLSPSGPVTRLALRHDANAIAYVVNDGHADAVYGWTAGSGNTRFLAQANSVGAVTITAGGDIIVADRGTNDVLVIEDPSGAANRRFLAGASHGVSTPVGVAVSATGRILIANAATGRILAVDPQGLSFKSQECGCEVSGAHLVADSVYRLTDRVDRTIYLLDARSASERILFVPLAPEPIAK